MGRKSRDKRERKVAGKPSPAIARREKSYGLWLQQRGLRLGTSIEEIERELESNGVDLVRQRLLATHNVRMVGCGGLPPEYLAECWSALKPSFFCYLALRQAGHDVDDHPAFFDTWPGELRWGLDTIQQSVRLLFCGQITGAALLARMQLERWSENRAYNARVQRREGEAPEEFAERVWSHSALDSFGVNKGDEHLRRDGRTVSPRHVMMTLNKVAHAEELTVVTEWANAAFPAMPPSAVSAVRVIGDALFLAATQIRICIVQLAMEKGVAPAVDLALKEFPSLPKFAMSPLKPALWPANLVLIQEGPWEPVKQMASWFEKVLAGERPAGRLYNDAEMIGLAFNHFRNRAIRWADAAFKDEADKVGPLNQDNLFHLETPTIMTSEMAAVVATWLPALSPMRAAAGSIADAIRSAYWLWLEDDMRSMAALRVVLEQTARLRVWRLKPHRAKRLESRGNPASWLGEAGWKRLWALNRALGELTHYRTDANWGGAFELLVLLNVEASKDEAPFTARRHALETVTRLASREVRHAARTLSPRVADAFDALAEEIFVGGVEADAKVDAYLNTAHTYKKYELSSKFLRKPRPWPPTRVSPS
jgi:hypothetical protein